MTINLTPAQQAWLEAQVASGALPSIEDGVRVALADFMALRDDDLAWAKPYVDEARQSVEEGTGIQRGDDFLARLDRRIRDLKKA